jgi:hypothetical protein
MTHTAKPCCKLNEHQFRQDGRCAKCGRREKQRRCIDCGHWLALDFFLTNPKRCYLCTPLKDEEMADIEEHVNQDEEVA